MSFRAKTTERRILKKGIDLDESRRKREEVTIELRKNQREVSLQKRRQVGGGDGAPGSAVGLGMDGMAPGAQAGDADPQDAKQQDLLAKLNNLPAYVQMVKSGSEAEQVEAVTQFRKLLSIERNPPIQTVIDSGVVPDLVRFLEADHHAVLQFEAAWALTNIASGTSRHTEAVVRANAIPRFVRLLLNVNPDVREQAVWALGNIAGDCAANRDEVLRAGALEPLLVLCNPANKENKLSMLRNATWTLSNFCRGKPQPDFNLVKPALPILNSLLYVVDDEVLTDACWALSYLSDDNNADDDGRSNLKIQAVLDAGCARRLVELLMQKNNNVKTPALRTVGNIVTGDDSQTQAILNQNVLPCLFSLLTNVKKTIRKEACWTISNITAGNHEQIEQVIANNLIPSLVQILRNDEFEIQKEAAWAISNATSGGTDGQIRYLVNQGVIPVLCNLLECPDPKIIMVALEGIENILKVGDREKMDQINPYCHFVEIARGIDLLHKLQDHESNQIYQKAKDILSSFFDAEEIDPSVEPTEVEGGQAFAFGGAQQQNFNF